MPIFLLNLLPFLRNNAKIIFAITCFVLWSIGTYNAGKRTIQAKWDSANAEATIKAHQIETDNQILSGIIEGKHYATIKTIDSTFNDAVKRLSTDTSGNLPCTPSTSPNTNAATNSNKLYRARKLERLNDAKEAEINTQQLISLQQWVEEVK